ECYLNSRLERDDRASKVWRPMLGLKSTASAARYCRCHDGLRTSVAAGPGCVNMALLRRGARTCGSQRLSSISSQPRVGRGTSLTISRSSWPLHSGELWICPRKEWQQSLAIKRVRRYPTPKADVRGAHAEPGWATRLRSRRVGTRDAKASRLTCMMGIRC